MTENEEKEPMDQDSTPESGPISSDDIKKILSNQNLLIQKMKSMEKEMEESRNEKRSEPIKITVPPIDTHSTQENTQSSISTSPRKFIMKYVFKNVSKQENNRQLRSDSEEHCGVPWQIVVTKKNTFTSLMLYCQRTTDTNGPWSIETELQLSITHPNKKPLSRACTCLYDKRKAWGWKFMDWEEMEKDYLVDDKLTLEVHVNIEKMSGIYPKNQRNFDESNEQFSDVILVVDDQKFYVLKVYLATHSSYFNAMFLGGFQDSTMAEITLEGVNSEDFQKYLEVLYAESLPDESTVEGILHIADMYDTPAVVRRCEEFLLEKSKKSQKKKA